MFYLAHYLIYSSTTSYIQAFLICKFNKWFVDSILSLILLFIFFVGLRRNLKIYRISININRKTQP